MARDIAEFMDTFEAAVPKMTAGLAQDGLSERSIERAIAGMHNVATNLLVVLQEEPHRAVDEPAATVGHFVCPEAGGMDFRASWEPVTSIMEIEALVGQNGGIRAALEIYFTPTIDVDKEL